MPGFDGKGPAGVGPMTGGGRGFCASPHPGMAAQPFARGFFGRGGGRGRRNRFFATGLAGWQRDASGFPDFGWSSGSSWTAQDEKQALMDQVEFLKEQINELKNRIAMLEKEEG